MGVKVMVGSSDGVIYSKVWYLRVHAATNYYLNETAIQPDVVKLIQFRAQNILSCIKVHYRNRPSPP